MVGFSLNQDRAVLFEVPYPAELIHKSAQHTSGSSTTTTTTSSSSSSGNQVYCGAGVDVSTNADGTKYCEHIANESIFCQAKMTAEVVDENGKVVATEQSSFLGGHPITTFSFIDKDTNNELSGFNAIAKIKCDTPSSGFLGLEQNPVIVKAGKLAVHVYSKSADGTHLVDTFNTELTTNKVLLENKQEVVLGNTFIKAERILEYMDKGQYDSEQHIILDGDFFIAWVDYENIPYRLSTQTVLTHNTNGDIVSVDADIIAHREITADIGGSTQTPQTECKPNQVLKSGVCVTIGSGGSSNDIIVTSSDVLSKFTNCLLSNPDKGCLASAEFSPFYLIMVGFVAIMSASKSQPRQMVYGME
jgi:hypothetical protein